ncbi:hypothetical protein PPACK8108_LOCUS2233, partial [Phakopsora pachyrhizi]
YIFLFLFLLFLLMLFFFFPFLLFYFYFNFNFFSFIYIVFFMGIDDLALICTPFCFLLYSDPISIVLDCVVLLLLLYCPILFDL